MLINNHESLMVLTFLLSLLNAIFLVSAVSHISSLGKSKTYQKKERHNTNICQKILLLGTVKSCKYYVKTAKSLRNIYWLQIATICLCAILFAFSNCNMVNVVFSYFIYVKVALLDIPVLVYCMFMTKHAKHGGVTWKWEI